MLVTPARRKCPESRSSLLVLVPVTPGPGTRKCCTPRAKGQYRFYLGGPGLVWQALSHLLTVP